MMHKSAALNKARRLADGDCGTPLNNLLFTDYKPVSQDAAAELFDGLSQRQKHTNPKFFYDQQGSVLFEQITGLPEYYPTRTEVQLLKQYQHQMADCIGQNAILFEPGSGTSEKVRYLLDALKPAVYVPLDISADFLMAAARELAEERPRLSVHAVCADFSGNFKLPSQIPAGKKVAFYPGSTIGNFHPEQAERFLMKLRQLLGAGCGLLIGIDLQKDHDMLHAAYNDEGGLTAAFNRNVLKHANRILDADFNEHNFDHHAFYNSEKNRIEMHLVSNREQTIRCSKGCIEFSHQESIHTENSYKYTIQGFAELASNAGFKLKHCWCDEQNLFSVNYFEAA